jgi:hypothetical protein
MESVEDVLYTIYETIIRSYKIEQPENNLIEDIKLSQKSRLDNLERMDRRCLLN